MTTRVLPNHIAQQHAHQAVENCHILAAVSEMDGGILRRYLTPQHNQCNQQVAGWMQQAGMRTWQDEVGNQWGRLTSSNPDAKRLIIGSHLDTVPKAGAFDGILGVMIGIELAKLARDNDLQLPFHLDVVGFCDEEGTRFATTLIGSKALAGEFQSQWLSLEDSDGITMANAMRDFGLDINNVNHAALDKDDLLGYWETHIEQGPVLESLNQPVGIVSGIAGAKRASITFKGLAGHAGTTPMHLRQDALTAAAEFIVAVEKYAKQCQNQQVATVGKIESSPGATNVIAGECQVSLDARAQNSEDLDALVSQLRTCATDIGEQRNVEIDWRWTHTADAVECDGSFRAMFETAATENGLKASALPSGAGHDAMAVASLCPIAMLFIRSPGGLSHHPDEDVINGDVAAAISTLYTALTALSD